MAEQIFLAPAASPDNASDTREKWQDHALCTQVSPHVFFPHKGGSTLDAKLICNGCTVDLICLKYQMDFEDEYRDGVFGGLSGMERRRVHKLMVEDPSMSLEAARDAIVATRKKIGNRKDYRPVKAKAA